jgi:hypothetical protein
VRHPFLSLSLITHVALLALLYFYGGYQSEIREEAEVASSLRATTVASASKRLENLQTIKQLLEKTADVPQVKPSPTSDRAEPPRTLEDVLKRARDISQAIDAIDREIQERELADLLDDRSQPKTAELELEATPHSPEDEPRVADKNTTARPDDTDSQAALTDVAAENEVAQLEAKARDVLVRRQQRLEAKENGIQIDGAKSGSSEQDADGDASMLAEIGTFIGVESDEPSIRSTAYPLERFFEGEKKDIPDVDDGSLVLGRGRLFGEGGQYANRIYLNSWYIIGPFPGNHGNGLFDNPSYPPEKAVLLDAVYLGKDNRLLKWRYVSAHSYPLTPPDFSEDSVYYGYTEISVAEECHLTAWIGADDDVQVYLNDQLVWKGGNVQKMPFFRTIYQTYNTHLRDYNRTEGKQVLHFKKGRNTVFFKYSNGKSGGFLSIVLTR